MPNKVLPHLRFGSYLKSNNATQSSPEIFKKKNLQENPQEVTWNAFLHFATWSFRFHKLWVQSSSAFQPFFEMVWSQSIYCCQAPLKNIGILQ